MVAAAAIGGVATIGSAVVSSGASSKAADAATSAANTNNQLQRDIYDQNATHLAPYEQAGDDATKSISALLSTGGDTTGQKAAFDSYLGSTGYQFQFDQGQKAVTAALGSKGLLDSGAGQKSLTNYGQQQALSGFTNYYNELAGQQGVGLSATSALAGVGQSYANAVSANNTSAANTIGNAALSSASIVNSALGNRVTGYGYSQGLGSSYNSARKTIAPFAKGEGNALPDYPYGDV